MPGTVEFPLPLRWSSFKQVIVLCTAENGFFYIVWVFFKLIRSFSFKQDQNDTIKMDFLLPRCFGFEWEGEKLEMGG